MDLVWAFKLVVSVIRFAQSHNSALGFDQVRPRVLELVELLRFNKHAGTLFFGEEVRGDRKPLLGQLAFLFFFSLIVLASTKQVPRVLVFSLLFAELGVT
jgi:hypothetical protein